jgi:hypothetical protein
MNFSNFFLTGLKNTLKLKRGLNLSYTGTVVKIPEATVFDKWNVGDFSSADYKVVIEYGPNDIEHVNLTITARVNFASVLVYGRINSGRDLVKFSATVNESTVSVIATPYNNSDTITPLVNIILTYKATYSERINTLQIPDNASMSDSLGGELGTFRNWQNSNLANGTMYVADDGNLSISNIGIITVPLNTSLASDFIMSTLHIQNTDGYIGITTNSSTNTLTFTLNSTPNLNVINSVVATPAVLSTINNVSFGLTIPAPATFSNLTNNASTTLSPSNLTVTIAPNGTGTINISAGTTGTIDNTSFGSTTATTGNFNSLMLSGTAINKTNLVTIKELTPILFCGAI